MNDLNNGSNNINQENVNNVIPQAPNPSVNNDSTNQSNNNYINASVSSVSSGEDGGEKKKVIVIIAIVAVLVLVIILIVLSNTGDAKDNKNNNKETNKKDNPINDSYKDDYDKKDTIYIYYDNTSGREFVVGSYRKFVSDSTKDMKELATYKCNGTCLFSSVYRADEVNDLAIVDDDKFIIYDHKSNEFNEQTIDNKVSGKDVEFIVSGNLVVGYYEDELSVFEEESNFSKVENVEIQGRKVEVYKRYLATIESLKDGIYVVKDDYKEYIIYNAYSGKSKIAEFKKNGSESSRHITYEDKYILLDNYDNAIILTKNGKVQKDVSKQQYNIYEGKLIVTNETGGIEVYDDDKMISSYDFTDSRVVGMNYVVGIKDTKLLLIDALTNNIIADLGEIKPTESFLKNTTTKSVLFSETYPDFVTVFMEDTTVDRVDNTATGRQFSYDFKNNRVNVTDKATTYVSTSE